MPDHYATLNAHSEHHDVSTMIQRHRSDITSTKPCLTGSGITAHSSFDVGWIGVIVFFSWQERCLKIAVLSTTFRASKYSPEEAQTCWFGENA